MRVVKSLIVIAVGVLLTSCTPSLHPLYTEKELIFEPALLGRWVLEDDGHNKTEWTFGKLEGSTYRLMTVDDDGAARFEARLLKLGPHLFLDLYPEEPEGKTGFYNLHMVRAHTFLRVKVEDHVLSVSMLDQEWLEKGVETGGLKIAHERVNGGLLLTAPTPELQQFVLKVADNPDAFPETSSFRRVQ
jgi:hypothetical protein